MSCTGIGEEVQSQWGHSLAISKKGIPDKALPWQGSEMTGAVAEKATQALSAQLEVFIEKELCVGSSEGKE